MRKRIFLVLFLLVCLVVQVPAFAGCGENGGKHFLWEVQSSNATVFLLGSLHFFPKEMYPLADAIENAYQKADNLVVEVNLHQVDSAKMQQLILEKASYPANDGLANHLSKSTYQALQAKLKEDGLDIRNFNMYRPWFVAVVLDAFELQKLGFDPNYGIDLYFLQKAVQNKKNVLELESWDFQLELLSSLDDLLQDRYLDYTLRDLVNMRTQIGKLKTAWETGDSAAVEALIFDSDDPGMKAVYEKLFYERNRNMAQKIEGYLKTGHTYFVVVGAGHLVGAEGVVELLRKKGFAVNQL